MQSAFSLSPSSLVDTLFESMHARIVNGEIAQGEKVTEMRIATEYDVARPTAKGCLERLIVVGLLKRSQHKTAVVPTLGEAQIVDLFLTRELVETRAVEILTRRGGTPELVRRTQGMMELAARNSSFKDQVVADIDFHSHIVRETGSERLTRMHNLILGEVQMTMGLHSAHRVATAESVASEHAAIIEAIDAGDALLAAERMRSHLAAAQQRVLTKAESTSAPRKRSK